MLLALWLITAFLLLAWSLLTWAAHLAWTYAAALPWDQALARMQAFQLPPALEPWLGGAWDEWLAAASGLIQPMGPLLAGVGDVMGGAVPVLLWLVWGVGTALLLGGAAAGTAALWWWRRRRSPAPLRA